jgi:hypothetical protein
VKEYSATTKINASPATIFSILTDATRYPEWDPMCDRLDGRIALGEKLTAFSKLSPGRGFALKVTELVPGERMTWTGGMPFGLFKGERSFAVRRVSEGTVEFTVREIFSGPMLGLIAKSLPDFTVPFQRFVAGLKARAEAA